MLAKWLRKVFGSIRLFMTLLVILNGTLVVIVDIFSSKFSGSPQLYSFLGALVASAMVFVWKDTDRPAGFIGNGDRPHDGYGDGDA